jgi:hypothetical protein
MKIDTKDIVNGTMTIYGVGYYNLDPNGDRTGPLHGIRLYSKSGPARRYRTYMTKMIQRQQKYWANAMNPLPPRNGEWVVFRVAGVIEELP